MLHVKALDKEEINPKVIRRKNIIKTTAKTTNIEIEKVNQTTDF
jgi:hypothetical protein